VNVRRKLETERGSEKRGMEEWPAADTSVTRSSNLVHASYC
jgi:hypothetical protein